MKLAISEKTRRPLGNTTPLSPAYKSQCTLCTCEDDNDGEMYLSCECHTNGRSSTDYFTMHCGHRFGDACMLSRIDELEVILNTKDEDLFTLINDIQTTLGKEELKRRMSGQ